MHPNKDSDQVFDKLSPENIVFKYLINMQAGDFGILDEVKEALHQQIAYELVKAGQSRLLADNLDKFKSINMRSLTEMAIEAGDNYLVDQLADIIEDMDLEAINIELDKI